MDLPLHPNLRLLAQRGRGLVGFAALRVSTLTRRRLKRGVLKGVVDLQAAINRYLEEHNADSKPFVWTKPAAQIFDKLARLLAPSV